MFSFTFLSKFSYICNFAIFVGIFMKFSTNCRTKKLEMIYTILGSFCSFINWEGVDIRPQIRPRKSVTVRLVHSSRNDGIIIIIYKSSTKAYDVVAQKNRLIETVLLSNHIIGLDKWIRNLVQF